MKKIIVAITLCVISLGVAVAEPTPIDVNTKLYFETWIPISWALEDAGIGKIGDAIHDKIQNELYHNRKGRFSIAEAVKVCAQVHKTYHKSTDVCNAFGKQLVVRYNEYVKELKAQEDLTRKEAAFYKKYNTVAKLKQLIKPGKKYKGAESSGYYVAENNSKISSCFSPCVFKVSNNAYVCCFMLCSDGVMVMEAQNEYDSWTACSTQKDPNLYIWEWSESREKNNLKIITKKSVKPGSTYDWWSDSDSQLEFILKNNKDMYGKYW